MRRNITLATKHRTPGSPTIGRLWTMTDAQAEWFDTAVRSLALKGVPALQAAETVERAVCRLLSGAAPRETDPPTFHRARLLFPTLTAQQIEQLPQWGAPRGFIRSVVLTINNGGVVRNVRWDMDTDQAGFFNFMLRQFQRDGDTRDRAWVAAMRVVGAMLAGADVPENHAVPMLRRARESLPTLTAEQIAALPTPSEEDIRRLAFVENHG